MKEIKSEVPYGTLDLMILKTLENMGSLHGFGIARRIEQMAEGSLALNQGTSIPLCCGWSKRAGLVRIGGSAITIGGRGTTPSRNRARGNWSTKRPSGIRPWRHSRGCSGRCNERARLVARVIAVFPQRPYRAISKKKLPAIPKCLRPSIGARYDGD